MRAARAVFFPPSLSYDPYAGTLTKRRTWENVSRAPEGARVYVRAPRVHDVTRCLWTSTLAWLIFSKGLKIPAPLKGLCSGLHALGSCVSAPRMCLIKPSHPLDPHLSLHQIRIVEVRTHFYADRCQRSNIACCMHTHPYTPTLFAYLI